MERNNPTRDDVPGANSATGIDDPTDDAEYRDEPEQHEPPEEYAVEDTNGDHIGTYNVPGFTEAAVAAAHEQHSHTYYVTDTLTGREKRILHSSIEHQIEPTGEDPDGTVDVATGETETPHANSSVHTYTVHHGDESVSIDAESADAAFSEAMEGETLQFYAGALYRVEAPDGETHAFRVNQRTKTVDACSFPDDFEEEDIIGFEWMHDGVTMTRVSEVGENGIAIQPYGEDGTTMSISSIDEILDLTKPSDPFYDVVSSAITEANTDGSICVLQDGDLVAASFDAADVTDTTDEDEPRVATVQLLASVQIAPGQSIEEAVLAQCGELDVLDDGIEVIEDVDEPDEPEPDYPVVDIGDEVDVRWEGDVTQILTGTVDQIIATSTSPSPIVVDLHDGGEVTVSPTTIEEHRPNDDPDLPDHEVFG